MIPETIEVRKGERVTIQVGGRTYKLRLGPKNRLKFLMLVRRDLVTKAEEGLDGWEAEHPKGPDSIPRGEGY